MKFSPFCFSLSLSFPSFPEYKVVVSLGYQLYVDIWPDPPLHIINQQIAKIQLVGLDKGRRGTAIDLCTL